MIPRERRKRHIASNYLPDKDIINENHNIIQFRFVMAKIAKEIYICKVISLRSKGVSVKSASNDDENVTCRLMALEKKPLHNYQYKMPQNIIVTKWFKVSNILGKIGLALISNETFEVEVKFRTKPLKVENNINEITGLKTAKSNLKSTLPAEFLEVDDITDRKIDAETEEYLYLYLVKFKGCEKDEPVWLESSCFNRSFSFNKRKGYSPSEALFASITTKDVGEALKRPKTKKPRKTAKAKRRKGDELGSDLAPRI